MMSRRIRVLTMCLLSACARTDEAPRSIDTIGARDRPTYEAAVRASVLPDETSAGAARLAPSDTIDTSNYQAAAWWMGRDDSSPRHRWRFSAEFARYTSGVVVFKLDTLLVRDQQRPPFNSATADSIAVGGLRKPERLSTVCRVAGHRSDDRILGLMPDSTSGRWIPPRLAWFVDTVTSRFRRMKPDGLACRLDGEPD